MGSPTASRMVGATSMRPTQLRNLLRATEARPVEDERDTDGALVRAALVLLIAGHEVAAVVAEEDEDSVVGEFFLLREFCGRGRLRRRWIRCSRSNPGALCLPGSGECAEIRGDIAVEEACGCSLGCDGRMHVVLLVRLELRDEKEERLVVLLAEEKLSAGRSGNRRGTGPYRSWDCCRGPRWCPRRDARCSRWRWPPPTGRGNRRGLPP